MPLGQRLADAVHHGDRRLHPFLCAISMISSQRSAPAFFFATMVAHALHEDLAAAAGDRVEPGLHAARG